MHQNTSTFTARVVAGLLFISSLCPYLSWGGHQAAFLFQMEGKILTLLFTAPKEMAHPMIFIPLLGQGIILFYGLFLVRPKRVYFGIFCFITMLIFVLLGGILQPHYGMLVSCIPFLLCALIYVLHSTQREAN